MSATLAHEWLDEPVAPGRPPARPVVSVVVPAYNEALLLMRSLTQIHDYLRTLEDRYRWELLVVDDGSTDETGEIAEVFARTHPGTRVLHHPVNFKLGQALRYGFGAARGDYVVTIDCDLSYGPEHIGLLVDALRDQHARVALCSPYMEGGRSTGVPLVRNFLSRGANKALSVAVRGTVSTVTGMVRAYDRRFLASLDLKAMGTDINAEILYKAQILRARVIEVPGHLDWSHLDGRRSTIRLRRTAWSYLFSGFFLRPVLFFLIPGLLLLALSGYTMAWTGYHVLQHWREATGGLDPRFSAAIAQTFEESPHAFVVGGISLVLAVQLISLGILSSQTKRYFEELFHLGTSTRRTLSGHLADHEGDRR